MARHDLVLRAVAFAGLLSASGAVYVLLAGDMRTRRCRLSSRLARLIVAFGAKLFLAGHALVVRRSRLCGRITSPTFDSVISELSPLELALLAELNLELARAHEQVADDEAGRDEAREAARRSAAALRERARSLTLQAQARNAEPTIPGCPPITAPYHPYPGPERRKEARRALARRDDKPAIDGRLRAADRRTGDDRRRTDRRGRALASY